MFTVEFVLRWATFALWLFWLIHYWGGIQGIRKEFQGTVVETRSRFYGVLVLFLGLLTLSPLLMIVLASLGVLAVQTWAQGWPVVAIGALVTLLGMLGAYYSRNYLGKNWTSKIDAAAEQIVDSGPYGIVRHPIYTAMVIMHLGITLAFAAWWTWVVYVLLVVAYALKARAEEHELDGQLADYRSYRQRVRYRLVPGLW